MWLSGEVKDVIVSGEMKDMSSEIKDMNVSSEMKDVTEWWGEPVRLKMLIVRRKM